MTRPDVNAGPIERNLSPLKVGVDIGSRGRLSSSEAACSGFLGSSAFVASGDGRWLAVFAACALRASLSPCPETSSGNANAAKEKTVRLVKVRLRRVRGHIRIQSP